MDDDHDISLGDLCAICHSNSLKYKCPRCSLRTCSLACIKRHKLLSECSGVRDPAVYRKRKDLATPHAFDLDFNFITKVERSMERADQDADNRGIALDDRYGRNRRPIKGEHRFNLELERSGVLVRKAPAGMSRNKQNKSHWNQRHKCLSWTVEWNVEDEQVVTANCLESANIQQAFQNAVSKKILSSRKRKLDGAVWPREPALLSNHGETDDITDKQSSGIAQDSKGLDHPQLYFYLHLPGTQGQARSVTNIVSDTTIGDMLRGRVILEFPTIYVLSQTPNHLPELFKLVREDEVNEDSQQAVTVELTLGDDKTLGRP